ncbi:MAG: type I DNA topoisomerase [Halobacteriales archaeon]|nr:type I DNA topoisomerase [Halobacteriales archaeon]
MNRVLVVESGAKTRTIRTFLGGEYDVVACGGHIVDLPDDDLGVDVENDFSYTVEPIRRRGGDAVSSIRSKIEDADEVYLATDPDREGEAIAADLRDHAVPPGAKVYRIEFNAIVYPAVREALENPRSVNENRVEAQRARRSLDRLIGFILSSVAKFDPDGPHAPSVGRVQSPAIRLVVDREREIDAFDPRRYWTIQAEVTADDVAFEATIDGDWDEFEEAKTVVETLRDAGAITVETSEVDPQSEQNPLPPYTTDALQNDADYLLNLEPERTMELAQQLYEGVEIGEGEEAETRALITYMRTDSTRVSPSALNLAKEALSEREDLGEAMYKGRTWEVSAGAQDAHEAIRPTHPEDPTVWPENLEGEIDDLLLDLYTVIYKRFLASQMVPAVYRTTTLGLRVADYTAEAVGHELLEPGFLTVWQDVRPDHGREELSLPAPDAGTDLPLGRAWPEPQETRPPPRYREGSLVSELKDRGIGRPSTYGDILTKIKRGPGGFGYVRKAGNTLQPTEKGLALVEFLEDRFTQTVDYEYTARMEDDLDRIEMGELAYREFLEGEFEWLEDPYRTAKEHGWLESDRPTPPQIEFLDSLAEETGTDVPDEVYESKRAVSEWIDRLQEEIDPLVRLTDIYEAEVGGVDVHRFRLYFNEPLPDEEYEYLSDLGMKYQSGNQDHLPGFQFQRQDLDLVRETWDGVRARYDSEDVLEEFVFEVGGEA